MKELQSQLPTRWLETDNPAKVQALDKSGLKPYIVKAESIKPVLARVWHLVEEFWENFKLGCSTVKGNRISVEQQDIFKATGLPKTGRTVGSWFENKKSKVEQIGKETWNARHAMRLKQLCGVETSFKHEFPVNMIKNDTTRYVSSIVMEHLSGMPNVSHCNNGFLDAIEQGMNGNVTNWSAHISKRMKNLNVVRRNVFISHTKGIQNGFCYGVVTALLVKEQAPDLWQQVVENGAADVELLKKRRMNEINTLQDIELFFKERRMNEINGNGFELGNLKGEGKIESGKEDQYQEKRRRVSLALVDFGKVGSQNNKGVQIQVERKEGMNGLNYQGAGVVLQRIKVWLAEECAETAEQYLADREGWMEASVQEVSDGELFEQYSGDHILDNRMHGIPVSHCQSRRFSRWVELEQRKRMKERPVREHDKLLVISIEYILAHFVHKSKVPFAHGNLYVDPYIVFVHPQACRFLWACLSAFKVVLWSEKPRGVHDLVLQHILGGTTIFGGILSYSIEDCAMTRISREGDEFHGCYKDLTTVWEDLGDYGSANTLLIDTSNVATLKNQEGNVICPIPYRYQVQASHWQLETYLLPYLECLESVQSIPESVKKFPFIPQKEHTWEWSPFEEGRVTTSFASPFPPCRHRIAKNWKMFPSIMTETSNSQLEFLNIQCSEIGYTGQQLPITGTSTLFSESVPAFANIGSFEMYHGNSSRVFTGFNDNTPFSFEFCFSETMERRDMEEQSYVLPQQPTRWLETDNPDKLQALDKSGLKPYVVKAESIRQVLGQVWDLVEEFWLNFEISSSCSTMFGYRISVEQEDIFRATGLPNEGQKLGYWFENKNFVVKQNGKEVWKERFARRLKELCGVDDTRFMHELPIDMIKDDTTRYVASLVMEHLSGVSNVSHCNYGFLDAIEEGMNGNVTNWSAHITKKLGSVKKFYRKGLVSGTEETQCGSSYVVVIALLVREQAPDLWHQVVENGGLDVELLTKRKRNEITGFQEMELLKKRRVNEINGMEGSELLKMGNMKGEGKIEDGEGDQYGEKWQKLLLPSVDLEGRSADNEGVRMQNCVERKDGEINSLDSRVAGAVLRRIKGKLADECAETMEQYLADGKGWEASVREISDGELLDQYIGNLNFRSGDHIVGNQMPGILKGLSRRFSGRAESEQRKMMKEIRVRKYDKLLVISIEYVLAHFVHKRKIRFAPGGLYVDPYIVFVHPQARRFLWACFSVFKVVLWSEKPREVHDFVLQHILGGSSSGRILSYSIEDCIITRINQQGDAVHGCYKNLTRVWEDMGGYGSANTLLIDTSNVARVRNQDGNVICPLPYQHHVQASHWQLETYLLPYLECLESVQGVPEFLKRFPFRLEKGYTRERSQFEEGRVIPLFTIPCPPHHNGIVNNWNMFPSIVTETSNSQSHLLNIQCLGISNTSQQFPITRTSISFSQSVPHAANFGIFEMYHGISSRVFLGFSDQIQSYSNSNNTRELINQGVDNMKYMKELNQGKVELHNMTCEKEKLEKTLQEKEHYLQKVVDILKKVNEEKKKAEEKNADLSKAFVERGRALKQVKLEKNLRIKQIENIICSLRGTVQVLQEKLGSFEKEQEFQMFVKREVEKVKETAQIRSTLTTFPGMKQEGHPVVGTQKLINESMQQWEVKHQSKEVKHQSKPDQFMLIISPDVQQSTVEPYQQISKGTSSHMAGDESTSDRSHLLLASDTEALHCSICMEQWTTAGNHRICSLACGHMFGMSCIREWLQLHENNVGQCPQCNKKAELGDIRILYVPVIGVSVRQ